MLMFVPLGIAGLALLLLLRSWRPRDLVGATALILPWSLVVSPYCWGHDYILCFPVGFVALDYFRNGISRRQFEPAISIGILVILSAVIGDLLSPHFEKQSMFILYGLSLCLVSGACFYMYLRGPGSRQAV